MENGKLFQTTLRKRLQYQNLLVKITISEFKAKITIPEFVGKNHNTRICW